MLRRTALVLLALFQAIFCSKIVISNDDGWATAAIRAQYLAMRAAGHKVLISAPAFNKSGSGNSTTTPTPTEAPCEFDTCPAGSPAIGHDPHNKFINYVNAFPVDAASYGVQHLAPELFGSGTDITITGPNVGNNLGPFVLPISGTVRAAAAASLLGTPAVAFSGASGSQVSYTTLITDPNSESSRSAVLYGELSTLFLHTLMQGGTGPVLPPGIALNVNYASIVHCPTIKEYSWILTRVATPSPSTVDVKTCGKTQLPEESDVIEMGCYATVSVFDAQTIKDVDASTQAFVLARLRSLLSCLPESSGQATFP